MNQKKIYKVCLTGLMAAIIAVFTAFVSIRTGINDGYLHFGDSMIYLAGCIIGPFGIISAAIGGALADIIAGAAIWAIPTAIIKSINCIPFVIASHYYKKKNGKLKIVNKYTIPMVVVSAFVTIFGYLLSEGLMYSFPTAWTSVPSSIIQSIGSAAIFIAAGLALDKANIGKLLK
ncbi:MAG: ECF transporter S component [Faecalibacterium sp.]|nr:ECF transporter S component [Ruminococcus sp.]MCM1391343.1 ECF transporter S component [Ruminococcus sp.]MCM1484902.1 ECF transporter S component [Faecalibacterium sp.]